MAEMTKDIELGITALKEYMGEDGFSLLTEDKLRRDEVVSFKINLPVDYLGVSRTLRLAFNRQFPRLGLSLEVSPSPWLQWPHATDQSLCLYGVGQKPVAGSPETLVKDTMHRLNALIELVLPETDPAMREKHFTDEITSYWDQQLHLTNQQLVLLSLPREACELFVLSDLRQRPGNVDNYVWLARSAKELQNHAIRITGISQRIPAPAAAAFFVCLESLPDIKIPEPKDILNWISEHVSEHDLTRLVKWEKSSSNFPIRWLLLSLPNTAPVLVRAFVIRGRGLKQHGNRPYGKRAARRRVLSENIVPPNKIQFAPLHVLDHSTIYSRDPSLSTSNLPRKKALLIGAGTLGSSVAMQLARSGVGHLTIIDPDILEDANIGRHVLGADELGRFKVNALAERINRDLPLTQVLPLPTFLQFAIFEKKIVFENFDVIVVTTADWLTENLLWEFKSNNQTCGLVQGWAEPHAMVGHVIAAPSGMVCDARSLFEENGNFHHRFSNWQNQGIVQLPACGAGFIPGSSLSINNIANMISRQVIEVLTVPMEKSRWCSHVNSINVEPFGGSYCGPALPHGIDSMTLTNEWPLE